MIENLKKMFDFFYLREGETKEEYIKRVQKRGIELLNGIECTLEESVNYTALSICKSFRLEVSKKHEFFGLTNEEIDLDNSSPTDFEKHVFELYFNNLDETEFDKQKKLIWDMIKHNLDVRSKDKETEKKFDVNEQTLYERLLKDETFIGKYGDLNAEYHSEKVNKKRFSKK